jgi:hypothetical protein
MNLMTRSLGAAVFGLLACAGASAQEETQESTRIIGSLQDIEGTVLIKRGDVSIPVVEGQQVWETDNVLVTEGARALMVFLDGCDMQLDEEELYEVPRRSPCATLWWAGPAAAATACGVAHANNSSDSQTLAAAGLAVGAGLVGAAQGRETKFREYAAALESAEGEVMATNAKGELEPIRPGTRLRAEQQVVVKDGAKALIRFDDGCTKKMEIVGDDGQESYIIPANSPCFTPPLWWASTAAAVGLCVTVENEDDVSSP